MKLDNFFDIETDFNFDKEKESFIKNIDMLKLMSVQESTLYKKWQEFNKNEKVRLNFRQNYYKSELFYKSIWKPTDIYNQEKTISEIENIEPIVVEAKDASEWTLLRTLISSMEFTANPGRNIRFFVNCFIDNINTMLLVYRISLDPMFIQFQETLEKFKSFKELEAEGKIEATLKKYPYLQSEYDKYKRQ